MNKKKELLEELEYKEDKPKKINGVGEVETKDMRFEKYKGCKNE